MINCAEDPRVALQLTRYHSWPRIRDQSIGEHSCQIIRILLTVWPDCPRKLLVYAVVHDMGEMAGDAQYPYKKIIPGLKDAHDRAEEEVLRVMGEKFGVPKKPMLSEHELKIFKIVEYVEMWEYGLHEFNLGNKYGAIISHRCIVEALRIMQDIEKLSGCPDVCPALKRYINTRSDWENKA